MDYFVGLFTSSLVSYTEKLRSIEGTSPVMHGAVPTQYEFCGIAICHFQHSTKSFRFHSGVPHDAIVAVTLLLSMT